MNEMIWILIVIGIMGGLLGRLIPWLVALYRKIRPARAKGNNQIQAASTPGEPSAPQQPGNRKQSKSTLMGWSFLVAFSSLFVGSVAGLFSQFLYILFITPLVLGLLIGSLIADTVRLGKIRDASQLLRLVLLAAIVVYASFHLGRYAGFLLGTSLAISPSFEEALDGENLEVAYLFANYALEQETGQPGFVGYMLYRAKEGMSVGRFYSSNRLNLGSLLTVAYWLLEFGIIFWIPLSRGRKLSQASFCESCGNWYGGEKHLGGTATANESLVLDLIRQKDFAGLGTLLEKNAEVPSLELYYQGCQKCGQSQSQLVLRRAFQDAKGSLQFSDAAETVLPPGESRRLLSHLSPVPAGD